MSKAKDSIHPEWYPNSKVYCDGQLVLKVGSTKPRLDIDVWSGNHPFYTGSQEFLDVDGRVARFLAKYGLERSESRRKIVFPHGGKSLILVRLVRFMYGLSSKVLLGSSKKQRFWGGERFARQSQPQLLASPKSQCLQRNS